MRIVILEDHLDGFEEYRLSNNIAMQIMLINVIQISIMQNEAALMSPQSAE